MTAAGLIVAAPASGSGKTAVTLALLRALVRRGIAVASAKIGPDYIDPAFHAAASGRPCLNLDSWAMRPAAVAAAVARLGDAADLVLCEGALGLFDGANVPPDQPDGSTADIALLTGWPALLVVDVRGQGASAAALIAGFRAHRPGVTVAGVLFNRVGSASHREILERACRQACPDLPILGFLPRSDALALPERHLGLVQARESADLETFLEAAAAEVAGHVDLDRLQALARPAGLGAAGPVPPLPPLGQRIAVADDDAFAFVYPAVLAGWRAAGAEILPFAPLSGQQPAGDADAVYLPGGYPELHAGRLATSGFAAGLATAVARGAAIFGECGGYMALGTAIIDAAGRRHAMAGLLPVVTDFARRRLHLGYRRAVLAADSPLGPAGAAFRGHEFHYASIAEAGPGRPLFHLADAAGRPLADAGHSAGRVAGSFIHLIDRQA